MGFEKKNIAENNIDNTLSNKKRSGIKQKIIIFLIVVLCVGFVGFLGRFLIINAQVGLGYISDNTIDIISRNLGKEMKRDIYGNVNILVVGIGGERHDGGMLADAVILASWNPESKSISMLSIPRDLYVDIHGHSIRGRINQVFSTAYFRNERSLDTAAEIMAEEIEDITGIKADYYAVVDFNGFKNIIDTIGGIEIDVPERIYDTMYPNEANRGYTIFHIERGLQTMDGDTALKYARSRYSTSDFSRSQRQQYIIHATIKQMLRRENIQNINTIKSIYDEYSKIVTTNIDNQEIIGMIRHIFDLKHFFNFGLVSACSHRSFQLMTPGCFLYTPNREWFGGASVLIPNGSDYNNISFYDYIRNFVYFIMHNQEYLIESAPIEVLNGIDGGYARSAGRSTEGHATQMAVKLRKYGFDIVSVGNAGEIYERSKVIVKNTGDYSKTIEMLSKFMEFDVEVENGGEILDEPIEINDVEETEYVEYIEETKDSLILILGNSYIDGLEGRFNYDR